MNPLLSAARQVLTWFNVHRWRCCVIGGLAVQRWGEPRLTLDVDLTVIVDLGQEELFVDAVLAQFAGRRPDARAFALTYRVLLIQAANGVAVDVALGMSGFEAGSVDRATPWTVEPGLAIPTCSAEDLIVHKLVAGRTRDVADIEGIVARQLSSLDVAQVRKWVALLAELKEDPDMGRPFEQALAQASRRNTPPEHSL